MMYLFLALASVAFITLVGDFTHMYWLYMISVLGIIIFKREDTTALHLCLGLFLFKALEFSALKIIPTNAAMAPDTAMVWLNTNNFLIHLVFDISVLLFLLFRPPLSRHYLRWLTVPLGKSHTDEALTYTQAEVWLISVMMLYFFVDLAAMLENFIRNLDHLGVNEEWAKTFWEWTLIYYLYEPTKNVLNLIELLAIWMSVSRRGRQKLDKVILRV